MSAGARPEGLRQVRIGVAGIGRAFAFMLPTFRGDPRVRLVAAADPRSEARERFAADFGGRAYATVDEMVRDDAIDAVYVATPHQHHAAHVALAAAARRHVLVEKPMALSTGECRAMIDACARAGVRMVVGHSHGFDAPIALARRIVDEGTVGRVRMITAVAFTDYLYRLRRPEELDTARGGGAVFNQAAHHVDIVRRLAGTRALSVRAETGRWDEARPTEGAYAALMRFEGGTFATIVYSGYAHFDSDAWTGWIGEMGQARDPAAYGTARKRLASLGDPADEMALKAAQNYGGVAPSIAADTPPSAHQHFGPLIVSCERGDLRPLPHGVEICGERERTFIALPPPIVPRAEVIDELHAAVFEDRPPLHDGASALATVEICLAMLRSAREGRDVALEQQVAAEPGRR
ncbi:MAG: Gfo/Idh/MocA family oxidoreductase [Betaproteobacteria bacterium]